MVSTIFHWFSGNLFSNQNHPCKTDHHNKTVLKYFQSTDKMLNKPQVFVIRSVSLLPYKLGSPKLVHTLILEDTYQPVMFLIFMVYWFCLIYVKFPWIGQFLNCLTTLAHLIWSTHWSRRVTICQSCFSWPWPHFHGLLTLLNLCQILKIGSVSRWDIQ